MPLPLPLSLTLILILPLRPPKNLRHPRIASLEGIIYDSLYGIEVRAGVPVQAGRRARGHHLRLPVWHQGLPSPPVHHGGLPLCLYNPIPIPIPIPLFCTSWRPPPLPSLVPLRVPPLYLYPKPYSYLYPYL